MQAADLVDANVLAPGGLAGEHVGIIVGGGKRQNLAERGPSKVAIDQQNAVPVLRGEASEGEREAGFAFAGLSRRDQDHLGRAEARPEPAYRDSKHP